MRGRSRPSWQWALVAALALVVVPAWLCAEPVGGDLAEIRARGALRVLAPRQIDAELLPRSGPLLGAERDHAAAFARELGLAVEWVYVDSYGDLLEALLDGRGDLVVGNLTVTDSRRERVAFSAPVSVVREQVVARAGPGAPRRVRDLAGRSVAARRSSSHWERLEALQRVQPKLRLVEAPDALGAPEILERVARGEYDLALTDSNIVRGMLAYRDDLQVAFDLEGVAVLAWAMRPDAGELRAAVDAFLTRVSVAAEGPERFVGDLDELRRRGVLRVLTRNNAVNYYIWNGQLMGFEYELARAFADHLGLRLEMVVPPSQADLLPWLREGRGDLVAASLTATRERERREGVKFTRRTLRVSEKVVGRSADPPLEGPAALAGRSLHVRRDSHHWRTLSRLRASGVAFELVAAPETLETEDIIDRVARGDYDLTLADGHIVDVELTWRKEIRAEFAVGSPVDHGWAVRDNNPELLASADAFLRDEYRGTRYNVLVGRYFKTPRRMRRHAVARVARAGRISPYDDLVRRHADAHGFDWRLIAAQMHQESRFDPGAISFAGARGLLQLMPGTARQFGVSDLADPEAGIGGGVRYLAWLRNRFDETLPGDERNWFALAAYNAGHGHVSDARLLAQQHGLDPDRWFGHVELAMLLKRRPEIARTTRFGWCRCDEPVRYVRAVRDRYRAYVRVTPSREVEAAEPAGRAG